MTADDVWEEIQKIIDDPMDDGGADQPPTPPANPSQELLAILEWIERYFDGKRD